MMHLGVEEIGTENDAFAADLAAVIIELF